MRSSVRRGGRPAVAWLLAAGAALGCGTGSGEPGGGSGSGPGGPSAPPATPVTRCSVTSDTALSAGEATSPAIAFGGGHFAVAWTNGAHGGAVVVSIVDADGHALHEQTVAAGSGVSPAVAALHGGGYLVAWEELAGAGGAVRAIRVGVDGGPAGSTLTLATTASAEAHPDCRRAR